MAPEIKHSKSARGGRQRGFTAIELMVTVAVLSILASLALPSFSSIIERWSVRNAYEGFQSSLYFARSEAIKRGGDVRLIPATGTDWSSGWIVKNTSAGATETLQEVAAPASVAISGSSNQIQFDRWGMVAGTWPGFTFYPRDKSASDAAAHRLCMSSGGRIRVVPGNSCT